MKYEIKKEEEEEKHLSSIVFGLGFWGGGVWGRINPISYTIIGIPVGAIGAGKMSFFLGTACP